jgi:hypothetical protein
MAKFRLAGEVAEASRPRPSKQRRGFPSELVATARSLERLLARRRKLAKELRRVEREIKHERKMLKALAGVEEKGNDLDTPMPDYARKPGDNEV